MSKEIFVAGHEFDDIIAVIESAKARAMRAGIEPKDWNRFKVRLYERIFKPRFYFYNRKFDLKVLRRGSIQDEVCNILKGILTLHIERMEKEKECN